MRRKLALLICCLILAPTHLFARVDPPHPKVDPHQVIAQSLFEPLDLTSTWLVHSGDDPTFASPSLDDSSWLIVDVNRPLQSYGIEKQNFVWYRTHVALPPNSSDLALLLRGFHGGARVFVNGINVYATAGFSTGSLISGYDIRFPIPNSLLGPNPITIAVETSLVHLNSYSKSPRGFTKHSVLLLSSSSALKDQTSLFFFRSFSSTLINLALTTLVLLVALAFALAFKTESEYLFLCLYLLGVLASDGNTFWIAVHSEYGNRFSELPGQIAVFICLIAGVEFARIILRLRRSKWLIAYEWTAAVLIFVGAMFYATVYDGISASGGVLFLYFGFMALLLLPINLLLPILALFISRRRGNFDALLLSVPLLIRSSIFYWDIAITLRSIFSPRYSTLYPSPPIQSIDLQWSEVTNFFFLLSLLFFLVFRAVRLARFRAALAAEYAAAQTVQQLLLAGAEQPTPGFIVESVYKPAGEVGGDFFLILPAPDTSADPSLLAVIGDVSGKGLQAAMVVSTIIGGLRMQLSRQPAEVLAHLNRALTGHVSGFATCCAVLIHQDGRALIANAGNPSPYIHGEELPTSPGLPLGLTPDVTYDETAFTLAPGARLTFVSDGVVEATSFPRKELFGFDRTRAISQQSAAAIAEAACAFGTGAPQADDITVLTVAYTRL